MTIEYRINYFLSFAVCANFNLLLIFLTTMTDQIKDIDLELPPNQVKSSATRGTLRKRLLFSVLPAVLIPLVTASSVGYFVTERRTKLEAEENLRANALLASDTVEIFFKNSFKTLDVVANSPTLIEAIQSANQEVQRQGLATQPIQALEQQFATTKLLQPNASLNNYLKQIVNNTEIVEIFFTDKNGFNVAYSNPTSDFVQRDEEWWQASKAEGKAIEEPEFDQSADATVFPLSIAVSDPQTQEFLGVIKAGVAVTELEANLAAFLSIEARESEITQIVDLDAGEEAVVTTINAEDSNSEIKDIIGGTAILQAGQILTDSIEKSQNLGEVTQLLLQQPGFSNIKVEQEEISGITFASVQLDYQDKIYSIVTIPSTDLIIIETIDIAQIAASGRSLLVVFSLTALVLGITSLGLILLLAQQLSGPLTNLSAKTQQVAAGNLDVTADLEGTSETRTLASNFNLLVTQVKNLLQEQQDIAQQQRQEKEKLESAIFTLLEEVSDATEGDLTVRANLDSMELSTVADLFNAIIDNLEEIAIEAKKSSGQVGTSLKQNENAIRSLAEQAIAEAKETRNTLKSVAQMTQSIQAVATNASQAEKIAGDTYNTVVNSTSNMNLTVNSILELRNTVNSTANKMQILGQSSQKISQAVNLIEEIALKTNVLAVNARVEARRAGEYGKGFTIVAEQVAALAQQSVEATQEIASIVSAIQLETGEVSEAMKSGTMQAVKSSELVEATKQSLTLVLDKSQEINQLMSSISQATVSQADTSQNITILMQKIAQLSATSSKSSAEIAKSMEETAQVAAKLESTVAQFKVAE